MKCDIVFYLAKKTALCEKTLNEIFKERKYEINTVTASTNPESLGMHLQCVNLVIIIGGLKTKDVRGISNVFSKALANSSTEIIPKRIKNPVGENDGYIMRSGRQTIICLPDNPEEMENMLDKVMLDYLDCVYKNDI